jgi:hypothetical protein
MSTKKNFFMKTNLLSLSAILALGFFTSNVEAQTKAEVIGTEAGAKLVQPMSLTETSALHFGTINVKVGAGGTVLLPSSSTTRVFSSGVEGLLVNPQPSNAKYDVTGTKNTSYALVLPATITVTETQSSANMTISALTTSFTNAGASSRISKLSQDGLDSFTVGGTLTVGPSQEPGIYAGTFNVSVDYN